MSKYLQVAQIIFQKCVHQLFMHAYSTKSENALRKSITKQKYIYYAYRIHPIGRRLQIIELINK